MLNKKDEKKVYHLIKNLAGLVDWLDSEYDQYDPDEIHYRDNHSADVASKEIHKTTRKLSKIIDVNNEKLFSKIFIELIFDVAGGEYWGSAKFPGAFRKEISKSLHSVTPDYADELIAMIDKAANESFHW